MSAIETNRSFAVGGFGSFVASLISKFEARKTTKQTRLELNRLSDRDLEDIGLCRGDIERVARGLW